MLNVLVAAVVGLASPDVTADGVAKAPVPDVLAQKEAEREIKQVFQGEYARSGKEDRLALSRKLLGQAAESGERPAAVFVLLREARDLAAAAGDVEAILKASSGLSDRFSVDPLDVTLQGLAAASRQGLEADSAFAVFEEVSKVASAAIRRGAYDLARDAAKVSAEAARASRDSGLTARARALAKEVQEVEKEGEKAKPALEKLTADAEDAEAAQTAGVFLCFFRGDWAAGLPVLAKAKDPALRDMASLDLAGSKGAAAERLSAADGWAVFAKKARGRMREKGLERASSLYGEVLPSLSGLDRARVEKAMGEIAADPALVAGARIDWESLKKTVTYRYEKKNFASGKFDYSDKDCTKLTDGKTSATFDAGTVGWLDAAPAKIVFDLGRTLPLRRVRLHVFGTMKGSVGIPKSLSIWAGTADAPKTLLHKLEPVPDKTGWLEVPLSAAPGSSARWVWIELGRSAHRYVLLDEIEMR